MASSTAFGVARKSRSSDGPRRRALHEQRPADARLEPRVHVAHGRVGREQHERAALACDRAARRSSTRPRALNSGDRGSGISAGRYSIACVAKSNSEGSRSVCASAQAQPPEHVVERRRRRRAWPTSARSPRGRRARASRMIVDDVDRRRAQGDAAAARLDEVHVAPGRRPRAACCRSSRIVAARVADRLRDPSAPPPAGDASGEAVQRFDELDADVVQPLGRRRPSASRGRRDPSLRRSSSRAASNSRRAAC